MRMEWADFGYFCQERNGEAKNSGIGIGVKRTTRLPASGTEWIMKEGKGKGQEKSYSGKISQGPSKHQVKY